MQQRCRLVERAWQRLPGYSKGVAKIEDGKELEWANKFRMVLDNIGVLP